MAQENIYIFFSKCNLVPLAMRFKNSEDKKIHEELMELKSM